MQVPTSTYGAQLFETFFDRVLCLLGFSIPTTFRAFAMLLECSCITEKRPAALTRCFPRTTLCAHEFIRILIQAIYVGTSGRINPVRRGGALHIS